ncbi:MAG: A24 family peptidase, partial [Hyphomicrobiaceae bacterium]
TAIAGAEASLSTIALAIALAIVLIVMSTIDIRQQRLPNALTAGLLVAGFAVTAATEVGNLKWHALAAVMGFGAFWGIGRLHEMLRGIPGLGLGDAKFLAAAGSWIGLESLPTLVLVAAGTALALVCLARLCGARVQRNQRLPFGPFLAVGFWYSWLFGPLMLT